ncbi:MAG: hypothetical protein CL709_06690 [Chloroflexi bacterium]|nr:hypothetical protein [Chloroflexota bacterium]
MSVSFGRRLEHLFSILKSIAVSHKRAIGFWSVDADKQASVIGRETLLMCNSNGDAIKPESPETGGDSGPRIIVGA